MDELLCKTHRLCECLLSSSSSVCLFAMCFTTHKLHHNVHKPRTRASDRMYARPAVLGNRTLGFLIRRTTDAAAHYSRRSIELSTCWLMSSVTTAGYRNIRLCRPYTQLPYKPQMSVCQLPLVMNWCSIPIRLVFLSFRRQFTVRHQSLETTIDATTHIGTNQLNHRRPIVGNYMETQPRATLETMRKSTACVHGNLLCAAAQNSEEKKQQWRLNTGSPKAFHAIHGQSLVRVFAGDEV